MKRFSILLLWLLSVLAGSKALAQNLEPVQVTTQLVPPYSVYLADYAQPGQEKLRIIMLQRDLSKPLYQVRLVMRVDLNGRTIMQTSRAYQPPPLSLEPGVPTVISGAELAPYLDSRNVEFTGFDRAQYERNKALPEGAYTICFTAYDYRRQEVPVSNAGCSFYFLAKNEPPLINTPACETKIPVREPQQIIFSWLPRNTASPTSAGNTEYNFSLYEVRFPGRNPNDIVMTTPPVYTATVDFTQLVYGPSEPALIPGMGYVWRVQAKDKGGKDAFRNHGYSQVCTFTYGGVDPAFAVGVVQNFKVEAQTHRRALLSWQADRRQFESYRVEYKKTGSGYEWNRAEVKDSSQMKVFDLEPDTEYEARLQGQKQGVFGGYTELFPFGR